MPSGKSIKARDDVATNACGPVVAGKPSFRRRAPRALPAWQAVGNGTGPVGTWTVFWKCDIAKGRPEDAMPRPRQPRRGFVRDMARRAVDETR